MIYYIYLWYSYNQIWMYTLWYWGNMDDVQIYSMGDLDDQLNNLMRVHKKDMKMIHREVAWLWKMCRSVRLMWETQRRRRRFDLSNFNHMGFYSFYFTQLEWPLNSINSIWVPFPDQIFYGPNFAAQGFRFGETVSTGQSLSRAKCLTEFDGGAPWKCPCNNCRFERDAILGYFMSVVTYVTWFC